VRARRLRSYDSGACSSSSTTDLWPRLESLSKQASRSYVAVAYLASGASRLLRLGGEDVLVIDMSDASVKTGHTDPKEVLKYLRKGVSVFSVENLHAKAFVFDDTVVVGSANVSNHSRNYLAEAAIETTNPALRENVRMWIESLALAPVTPKVAAAKSKLYHPPKWAGAMKGERMRGVARAVIGRLWITNCRQVNFSEEEAKILDRQAKRASKLLKDPARYEVDTMRYGSASRFSREARLGHSVIVIHRVGNTIEVYPPARVVYARPYKAGGKTHVGIHLERRARGDVYYWSAFQKAARAAGVKVTKHSNRELREPSVQESLLRFFGGH
jgi:phospholipase D-like protein